MTTNSQLSATEPKKKKKSKQLEQEENHRNGDHVRVIGGGGGERMEEKVQERRSIIGRYKIDKGRLRIVWEMEKPKSLYVQPMDIN